MTEQISRIKEMEEALDTCAPALRKLTEALDVYEDSLDDFRKLRKYYEGTLWMIDYEDDEEGKLPADLKRGVLSEDTVYDLLQETHDAAIRMLKILLALGEKEY